MSEPIYNCDELTEGTAYAVSWDDCCAAGSFTAVLTEKRYDTDIEGTRHLDDLVFANGVILDAKDYGTAFRPVGGAS